MVGAARTRCRIVGRNLLVVADAAMSQVAATLRAGIVGLIRRLRDRLGIGFLAITDDLDMAGTVAEQVAVMRRGNLLPATAMQESTPPSGHAPGKGTPAGP